MKIEEWENKTDEWKNGYLAYANSCAIENPNEMSKDWWLGFDYAFSEIFRDRMTSALTGKLGMRTGVDME